MDDPIADLVALWLVALEWPVALVFSLSIQLLNTCFPEARFQRKRYYFQDWPKIASLFLKSKVATERRSFLVHLFLVT